MRNRIFSAKPANLAIYVLSFVVFIVTAVANYGYHHADELFQIIEYAGLKTDTFTPLVAWEYDVQIRPMLQPTICLGFLKLFEFISVSDPYVQAMVMRIFAAVVSALLSADGALFLFSGSFAVDLVHSLYSMQVFFRNFRRSFPFVCNVDILFGKGRCFA